jgi:hypothetical protein
MDAKAGTTSDAIEGVYTVSHNRKAQERQQLSIEGARCREISSRDERVGHTVDLHWSFLPALGPDGRHQSFPHRMR